MGRILKDTIIGLTAVGVLAAGVYAVLEVCDRVKQEDADRRFDPWYYR